MSDYDTQALEGAAEYFEQLATGANPAPLAFAQTIRRAISQTDVKHTAGDIYTLAALYRSGPAKALEIAEREGRASDERIEARAKATNPTS
jgi:hypothetical protein